MRLLLLGTLLPVFLLLPFLHKPIHIDDAAYIAIARHIVEHPLDFYGLSLNWDGVERPVYEWHASPPLANYYLAAVGAVFGWSEWVLHLAFILPAALFGAAVCLLARRCCRHPAVAIASAMCTPAFVVSGTTLMLDVWLLAFFTAALALWVEGFDRYNRTLLFAAAVCSGLALWTKYFGVATLPLMLLYAVLKSRKPPFWFAALLLPIAMLALEQGYEYWRYGRFLFLNVADVVLDDRVAGRAGWQWLLLGLSFAGGSTFSVLQLGAVLWNACIRLAGTLLWLALSGVLVYFDRMGCHAATIGFDLPVVSIFVYTVFILGGAQLLSLSFTELRDRAAPESWLLVSWIVGTLVFTCFITWSVNVRSILPLVPAAAILAARRLEMIEQPNPRHARRRVLIVLLVSGAVSMLVARADMKWAQTQRAAAAEYAAFASTYPRAVYYQGHWGFQHYMSLAGVPHLDFETTVLRPGDVVICPGNNANVRPVPREYSAQRFDRDFPVHTRMATMSVPLGAGFYSDLWGPLPFALGLQMPPDKYYAYVIAVEGKPYAADTR